MRKKTKRLGILVIVIFVLGTISAIIDRVSQAINQKNIIALFLFVLLGAVPAVAYLIYQKKSYQNAVKFQKLNTSNAKKDIVNMPAFEQKNEEEIYKKKNILTVTEQKYYKKLLDINEDKYIVQSQIVLSSIINKKQTEKWKSYQSELNYVVDFGIVDKNTFELLVLVELNDESHRRIDRIERDKKVKCICQLAGYPLVTIWLFDQDGNLFPNTNDYIKSRLSKYLPLLIDKTFLETENIIA